MATKVDELIVEIRAETRQLRRGLDDVKKKVDKTFPSGNKSPINRMGGQLKGLLGPLTAVATAMVGISAIKGISKTGDEFQALGITLDRIYGSREAGARAFEDIKTFAETTPFQLEDVTKAFIQLKSNGIEPAEDMLTIFGDAASAALNPLEAFNTLIRITQRAAGGGLGLEVLEQLVNQGIPVYTILSERIGKTRLELGELGKTAEGAAIIMNALQAGLKEDFGGIMAERMDLLSTKTSNMEIAFKGLKDTLFQSGLGNWLKGLADSMTEFINGINEGLVAGAKLKKQQNAESLDAFMVRYGLKEAGPTVTFAEMAEEVRRNLAANNSQTSPLRLPNSMQALLQDRARQQQRERDPKGVQFMPEGQTPFLDIDPSVLIEQQEALARLKGVLDSTITPAEELAQSFADLALMTESGKMPDEELQRIREHLEALRNEMALEIINDQLEIGAESAEYLEEATKNALDAMKSKYGDLASVIEGTVTPIETLKDEISQLEAVLASGDADVIKFIFGDRGPAEIRDALDRLGIELKELEDDLNDVSKTFEEVMAPAIAAAAQAFTSDFVNSLMEGENALDSFKNFAKDIVGQIITTFLQMAVVNKILNAVFKGIDGFTPFDTIDIFGKAGGGSVNGGTPYLVGERGPEMFVPNSGGRIVNGHNTKSMMGGGGGVVVNQTINLSAGVVGTVRSEVQRMMPQIANVTKAGVLEATRRGGTYRRGLLGS